LRLRFGPRSAENRRPQCGNRVAPRRLRAGLDPRFMRALKPDLMLKPAIFTIRGRRRRRGLLIDEPESGAKREQRDVADVARQLVPRVAVRKNEVLDRELDVDHSARVVLEVE